MNNSELKTTEINFKVTIEMAENGTDSAGVKITEITAESPAKIPSKAEEIMSILRTEKKILSNELKKYENPTPNFTQESLENFNRKKNELLIKSSFLDEIFIRVDDLLQIR